MVQAYYDSVTDKADIQVMDAVSYVMLNLPNGVERVDGYVIEPLLNEVIAENQEA